MLRRHERVGSIDGILEVGLVKQYSSEGGLRKHYRREMARQVADNKFGNWMEKRSTYCQ